MFFKRKRKARHFEEIPFDALENENGKLYDNMQLVPGCILYTYSIEPVIAQLTLYMHL